MKIYFTPKHPQFNFQKTTIIIVVLCGKIQSVESVLSFFFYRMCKIEIKVRKTRRQREKIHHFGNVVI